MILLVILFALSSVRTDPMSYEGYKVMKSLPKTVQGQDFLDNEIKSNGEECNVWKAPQKIGFPTFVMCSNKSYSGLKERVEDAGIEVDTVIENVGDLIRNGEEETRRVKRQVASMNWDSYQRYDTIVSWMEQLAADNPEFITLTNMGTSHEGRKILMMKIGKSPRGSDTRAVWIDGGIHAREWVAISTATFLLDKLVDAFKLTPTVVKDSGGCDLEAVRAVDWYVAPILNPDGYEFSHTNNRMWRKNRSPPPSGSSCYGVDLNRNWDVLGFGLGVVSSNPCSETYKGTEANSEPETRAIAETIQQYRNNIRIYLSFHSYGQYWLTSWGYKTELPVDNEKLVKLGREAADAIQTITPGRRYTVGSAGAIFYVAGGASDDYAKHAAEIPYSFTVELPDTGSSGFLLPPSQIKTVGAELWAATSVLALEASRHPLGPDPARQAEIQEDQKLGLDKKEWKHWTSA